MTPETPSSVTIGKRMRERVTASAASLPGIAEEPDHPRRDQDEDARQGRQPEQHQIEHARRDAPGAAALALLQQIAEDGHEGRREGGVGDERADQVRDLERDRERIDRAGGAEEVGGDHLAHEPEHAREAGRDSEDGGRDGEPAVVLVGRRRLAELRLGQAALELEALDRGRRAVPGPRTAPGEHRLGGCGLGRLDREQWPPLRAPPLLTRLPARGTLAGPLLLVHARSIRRASATLRAPIQVVGTFRDAEHQAAEEARPDRR